MNDVKPEQRRAPILWVPTLYFAEGLPYFVVATIAGLMYKSRGVPNDLIARYTGILGFVWVFKPLWSPFLETFRSKKSIVILFEVVGGIALGAVALALPLPSYFMVTITLLGLVAIASATHDIAADGLYIGNLSGKQQAAYAGWQGGFYNVARFFSIGGLVILAGYLETRMDVANAWMVIFGMLAVIMVLLAIYHSWSLPGGLAAAGGPSLQNVWATLHEVIVTFFQKPGIWLAIIFIILFRAGEGQVTTIGPLFLKEPRISGGLGLTTEGVGEVYGTFASIAFIIGSIIGGYFTAWRGLRRSIFFLILAMNLPNLAYFFLSNTLPTDTKVITMALSVEMFGYGFGFVGLILFMMQEVAPGKYQTAHYSLATGFMQLGYVIFKMISGDIQLALGYQKFFVWVLISAIPALILSKIIPFRHSEDKGASGNQTATA
jgi:MFS transporter, PAT family, beta-lactamase induction signal transducer AmpG